MKRILFLLSALYLLPLAATAATAVPAEKMPDLQLAVDVPILVDPLYEDDVIDIFESSLRTAFRRRGYEGRIENLNWTETPRDNVPLLKVRLMRWQRTRTGGVECTFSAAIRPPGGEEQPLGLITQTDLGLGISSRFTLAEAFRDSAETASEQLYRRIAELNVVPGITVERR